MKKLALQLTCYNGSRYLPYLFDSLSKQTNRDWQLFVLDNGSNDEESKEIKRIAESSDLPILFHTVQDTLNFANGHNFLHAKHEAEYVQLLNDDAILEPEYLARVLSHMESTPECASASGRVYKWDFEQRHQGGGKMDVIDSCGLERKNSGWVTERLVGLDGASASRYIDGETEAVFGVSGCLPMYRRSAALKTSPDNRLFDPTFISYKEDVEIAYRLGEAGYVSSVVHKAIAYHNRSFSPFSHNAQRKEVQMQSYRNHLWIHVMHTSFSEFLSRSYVILPFEIAKIGYWIMHRPWVLTQTFSDTAKEWKNLMRKRKFYLGRRSQLTVRGSEESFKGSAETAQDPSEFVSPAETAIAVAAPVAPVAFKAPETFETVHNEASNPPISPLEKGGSQDETPEPPAPSLLSTLNHKPSTFFPPPSKYDIVIVTVTHNDLNEEYLTSVKRAMDATDLKVQLVIVDNNSTKFRANEVVDRFAPGAITLLRNGDHGFGRSSSRGAREIDADYVFFLNPDTVIPDPDIFDRLHGFMKDRPKAGIVAPKLFYLDGRLQETCRRFPKWYMPFVQRSGLKNSKFGMAYVDEFQMRDYDHERLRMVDWCQGSALFMDKKLCDELGAFDDRFWMYFEDIDLCRRSWEKGRPVYYWPDVQIRHAYGKGSAKEKNIIKNLLTNQMARAHIASWLKYVMKWGGK